MALYHQSIMIREAIASLGCRPGALFVDGTLGGGGHAEAILRETAPDGRLIGIDADNEALAEAEKRLAPFGDRKTLVQGNFAGLGEILGRLGIGKVDGILLDLGVSSHQLDQAERGFSFTQDAALDMRMDQNRRMSAKELVNTFPEAELARIIREYGEERMAKRIARRICEARAAAPIETTAALAAVVLQAMPREAGRQRIHPATRTFQALRIAVNQELTALEQVLTEGVKLLVPRGRFSVISFHSLEDRL
ncbi:MAG: 16S rRNA (cytosine(1402)-N(4))-methyltransferase RsmH, partial [Syntrophaceae bacterium]|nr:16S rRNA (cytosine(1402)-N(4))-methyltransferase RsmH [Syntrophaceae bacterium]